MDARLPSKADRQALYHAVIKAANFTLDENLRLDTSSSKSAGGADAKRTASSERYRKRMQTVLREQVPQQVGSYLLLESADYVTTSTSDSSSNDQPSDPFACIALLLANHIIHCDMTGYDARTRGTIKVASVHVLAKDMGARRHPLRGFEKESIVDYTSSEPTETEPRLADMLNKSVEELDIAEQNDGEGAYGAQPSPADSKERSIHFLATRKFEEIEQAVALKLFQLLMATTSESEDIEKTAGKDELTSRGSVMRALKIGSAAVAAGTLLAVTGGMAAPGIAAGIGALGIGTTAALTTLTSTTMMATLFGVGGGGLAAYKMKRRTDGLSEFCVRREGVTANLANDEMKAAVVKQTPQFRSTVCISGWLGDKLDFQRPWGVTPTDPPLTNKLELLKRFFSVYSPEKVFKCDTILKEWKGKEEELWQVLHQSYGRDPDHLLPIVYDSLDGIPLTKEEDDIVGDILSIVCIGKSGEKKVVNEQNSKAKTHEEERSSTTKVNKMSTFFKQNSIRRRICAPRKDEETNDRTTPSGFPTEEPNATISYRTKRFDDSIQPTSAWDFLSLYGGDLYTVTWESTQLLNLSDIANTLIRKMANTASKEVLKQTMLATLMSAVAFPSTIMKFADLIDEPWSLISLRADEAGVELANCLLQSDEHKPVSLISYSFGSRIVYSCLKELARHQEMWELQQEAETVEHSSAQSTSDNKEEGIKYSREPASIVEDIVLMGTPKFIDRPSWIELRRVVAGRLINCYSTKDWILSLLFQVKNVTGIMRPTVGTSPVEGVEGVENYDTSDLITSHDDYCIMVQQILRVVGYGEPKMLT